MPAKNFLTSAQKERLQKAVKESDCPRLREHALILLLQNDGRTYEEIAEFLGCSYRTVAYWCVHGDPDNLETLRDKREQGNYRKVTDDYLQLLLEVVEKEPSAFGFDFARWSTQRLASYMGEKTGIQLSGTQVSRILKQKKVRLPGRHSLA